MLSQFELKACNRTNKKVREVDYDFSDLKILHSLSNSLIRSAALAPIYCNLDFRRRQCKICDVVVSPFLWVESEQLCLQGKVKEHRFIDINWTIRLSHDQKNFIPEIDSRVKSLVKFVIDSSVVMILILTPRLFAFLSASATSSKLNEYKARQTEVRLWLISRTICHKLVFKQYLLGQVIAVSKFVSAQQPEILFENSTCLIGFGL